MPTNDFFNDLTTIYIARPYLGGFRTAFGKFSENIKTSLLWLFITVIFEHYQEQGLQPYWPPSMILQDNIVSRITERLPK